MNHARDLIALDFFAVPDGDLSSALCADRAEPWPASAGAFPDGGMDGTNN